jgi:hypothetical protein
MVFNFEPTESKSVLDITGSIISFIGLILFVWAILMLTNDTSTSIVVIILGLVILAAFVWFEIRKKRKSDVPLLDFDLFKDKNLCAGLFIRLIDCLAMGGALFAISLFLQSVMQLNALNAGLTTLHIGYSTYWSNSNSWSYGMYWYCSGYICTRTFRRPTIP